MQGTRKAATGFLKSIAFAGLLLVPAIPSCGQDAGSADQKRDADHTATLLRELQQQVQDLRTQVNDLRVQQTTAKSETEDLRRELATANLKLAALSPAVQPGSGDTENVQGATEAAAISQRLEKLEENQQMADAKSAEQSQTKVESGSKYRVRLTGMVLLNMYGNHGTVDNSDFPQLATSPGILATNKTFGGSLRQSQIGIQAFGPTIAGARTSADVEMDFAGGFPDVPNGASFGLVRLRTGTVRFDWTSTSVIAGQDGLFFSPLSPTSVATLATPALSYSGNLWGWTPQIRVEHKLTISDNSALTLQAGLLDSLSGDVPFSSYYREQSWAESSGQPGYAGRVAWSRTTGGQTLSLGAGGYYGRQDWGYGRGVDGWAGTIDAKVPLGNLFEFTGQFYRGRAIGGFGAGLGQTVIWNGSLVDPATVVYGLNSMGGWAQLKYRATPKLQFNGAFGLDNPFANELREDGGNTTIYQFPLSKNETGFVNFIYQPRSNLVFSMEYRRIKTFTLDSSANTANISNLSIGYIF